MTKFSTFGLAISALGVGGPLKKKWFSFIMDVREKPCLSSVFDQQTLRNVMDDSLNCRENDRLCLLEDANQTALWASLEVKSKSQWDTGDSLVYHVKSLIESIDESLIESMEFLCSFLEIKKNLVSDQTTSAGSKALKPFSKSRSSLYLKGHTSKVMKTELKQNYSNDYMNSTYSIEESLFKDLCDDTFSELKIRTELQFGLSLTLSYFELALTVLKIAHKSNFYNLELTSNMLMPIENPLVFDAAFPEEYSHLIYNFSVDMNNPIPFIVNVESNNDMLVLSPSRLRALTSNHSNEHLHFLCQYYLKNHVIPEMMDVVGVKKSRRQSRPHDDCVLNDLYSKLTHLPPDADIERKPEVNLDSDSSCYSDSQYTETGCSKVNVEVDTCTFAKEHVDGELGVNSAAELNSICENSDSELSDNVNHNESNVEGLAEPYLSDKFSCSFKSCSDCSDAEPLLETCKDDQSDVNSTAEVFVSNKLELETSGKVVDKSVNNLSSETSTFEVNDMDFSEDALKVVSKLRAVLVEVGANDLAILCHDSDDIASNLFISLAFFNKGCFHQAIDYLKLTQHMLESENDYLPSVAVQSVKSLIYFYLGEAEYNLSNFSTAVHYYGESLDSHAESKFCDIPHVSESTKLEKLALALRANNQISESVAVYKRAIETSSKDVVSCHVGLGNLYHSTGSHEAALKEYEVALELAEKQNDYKSLCWINGNLGNSCFSLGMKRRGIFHLELALDLTFEHDPSPSSISRALNNLGTGYQSLGDFETAKKYFDQALCQATYGEDKIGQARAYGNIGNVCMTQKDYEQAIPHYTEVLELSNDASVVNVAYHNRGCAYYELSEAKRKQQTCEQRQEFQYVGYGPNVSEQHTIDYTDQACQSYYRLGLEDLEKVIAHHEYTFRNEQILPESADLFVSLFESNLKTFARAQDCAHILGQHHHALLLAEQSRSRTLAELMLKKNSFNLQKPLQSPLTLNQVRDIMHLQEPNVPVVVLSWTGKRLLAWILLFDGNAVTMDTFEQEPGEELFGGSSLDVFLRYSLSQMLSDDLERCGDQASKVDSVKFSSLSDEDEGCYSYTENEMHKEEGNEGKFPIEMIKNVAIPRKFLLSMKEKFLPVGVKYTDKTMKLSLAEMEEDGLTRQLKNDRELLKMSSKTKLFKLVAEPLKEIIESTEYSRGTAHGKRKIIIIPDSTTKLIPFSSLRKSDDTAFCFGDDYSLSFMPSLLTLGIMSQTPSIVITIPYDSKNILIVGDPLTPPFTIKDREWNLGPLPHAREEAEWVGHYMKSKPLLKHEPTKDVVISRLKSAKIVHLATHGSATQSFLVLAGSTYDTQSTLAISISKTMVQDEKQLLLYASDIESLSLKSALVVLSSCDSGRGVIKGGDIQGMARAFLLAGAQSVVTSLWKIPDKSGRFFMQFFYRFLLDGHSSVEALNMASCSIRAFEEFSSMIHWSGYQITGKDITIQQGSSDEERTLKKAFGRGCTAFPRLEVLKNLQKAIIDERSTDIQVRHNFF